MGQYRDLTHPCEGFGEAATRRDSPGRGFGLALAALHEQAADHRGLENPKSRTADHCGSFFSFKISLTPPRIRIAFPNGRIKGQGSLESLPPALRRGLFGQGSQPHR